LAALGTLVTDALFEGLNQTDGRARRLLVQPHNKNIDQLKSEDVSRG